METYLMHFYTKDGQSMHEVLGANGKMKATTIREARKLGLFPSVTTIMDVQAKPALLEWMKQQILQTAIEHPFHPDEYQEDVWRKTIMAKTKARTDVAATRGTEIHNKLEHYYTQGHLEPGDEEYIIPAIELIDKEFKGVRWVAESSFVDKEIGYAGRVDMYSKEGIVLDFKTKDKSDIAKAGVQYDDHKIQLAAYQEGLDLHRDAKRYNLFISTHKDTPGQVKLVEAKEFDKYLNLFYTLVRVWQLKNNYIPGASCGH